MSSKRKLTYIKKYSNLLIRKFVLNFFKQHWLNFRENLFVNELQMQL